MFIAPESAIFKHKSRSGTKYIGRKQTHNEEKNEEKEREKMPGENVIPFPRKKAGVDIYHGSIRDQVEHLMTLTGKERLRAISESPDPGALVQQLPEQDFYITVKEVDEKDSLILIRNASPSQLKFIFDMEWWERYVPEAEKAWEWLEYLRSNAPGQLLVWLKNTDIELLISLLKKWLVVEKAPDPDDIDFMEATDRLPPYTIDNIYYWNAKKGDKLPLLKTILTTLFELDQKFYFRVMEGIIWGIPAELEEDAYRWRKGRLEDLAIPDFYDALEIYKEIGIEEFYKKHPVDKKDSNLQTSTRTTIYPLVLLPRRNTLSEAVERINDPGLLDFLKVEFAALANKVVIADRLAPGDPESLRKAVEKVIGYVQLGLDRAGKKTAADAARFIETFPLESVFRLGYTLVRNLKKRAKKIRTGGWIADWPHNLMILPSPYQLLIEALMLPDPQYLEILPDGTMNTRPFNSLDEIIRTSEKLSEIEWLGEIYRGLEVDYNEIAEKLWPLGQPGEPAEIRIDDLIITALANQAIDRKPTSFPVPRSAIPEVIGKFQKIPKKSLIGDIDSLVREIDFSSEQSRRSNIEYIRIALDNFVESISDIRDPDDLDPRYIEGILIEK